MAKTIMLAGALAIMLTGIVMILYPTPTANRLQRFYSNYPLVRLAGEQQLRSRKGFIVTIGIVFVFIGVLGIITTILI